MPIPMVEQRLASLGYLRVCRIRLGEGFVQFMAAVSALPNAPLKVCCVSLETL